MSRRQSIAEAEMRRRGALTAHDLARLLRISQPTVSRLIAQINKDRLVRLGRGRAAHYALNREIGGKVGVWPIYTIDEAGVAQFVGQLHALEARQWSVEQASPWASLCGNLFHNGLFPGLPWFLDDLRPQGFLGRTFARQYSGDLRLSVDPKDWRTDDIVSALVRYGHDLQGAFILGDAMLALVQKRMVSGVKPIPAAERESAYPAYAQAALAGEWPGSSAAGEQPKFTASVVEKDGATRHVIVKFSGSGGRPEDQRWADLLAAEHLALELLAEQGIPVAKTCLVAGAGRRFLESTRFDRVGVHGRKGLVSLLALDAAFYGQLDTPWTAAADRLRGDGWLTEVDAGNLSVLWWFGVLIGNTDMHYGNVSLFLGPDRPLQLAPCYDMLPMFYRPGLEGMLPDDVLTPVPPTPQALSGWMKASAWAKLYWERVAETPGVSLSFREISRKNAGILAQYRQRFCTQI